MKVFIDTNILVDVLTVRTDERLTESSARLLNLKGCENLQFCISTISAATCFYFLKDAESAIKSFGIIIRDMQILSATKENLVDALESGNFKDKEDAMQHSIARRNACDLIITRNVRHFPHTNIPVMTPEDFLQRISE